MAKPVKEKNTRSQRKKAHPTLLITKYMGSKKAILDFVADELTACTRPGDIIVDIMAGTHTIGYALKNRCKIVANDIQRYSRVIGETLLNYQPEYKFTESFEGVFKRYYLTNLRTLFDLFHHGLLKEQKLLQDRSNTHASWAKYRDFCESYPYYLKKEAVSSLPSEFALLFGGKRVEAYTTLNKLEPYSLFSLYYANTYIGTRQAAEIDSIRCAIDKLCDNWLPENDEFEEFDSYGLRCMLIAALIYVLNRINPGPGHWAAYPRVNVRNTKYLKTQRSISVWDTFIRKVNEFEKELVNHKSDHGPHIIMTEDYEKFMDEVHEYIRQARVVYLDPPYSQGHYSRFYHLIETLTLYDYPQIAYQGRYREDRHQSPFAHKVKVSQAIGKICEIAREGGATLVCSYSKGGVLPSHKEFRAILEQYYPKRKIKLKTLSSVHSKLGQAKRMETEEYLFRCNP